jgi:hypothetical protein
VATEAEAEAKAEAGALAAAAAEQETWEAAQRRSEALAQWASGNVKWSALAWLAAALALAAAAAANYVATAVIRRVSSGTIEALPGAA